ncbi:aspartic peptidase domain-containing protein [Desarmillaria ectypa]|nr:aspartic peptidase domain-containing protein [Desarmillaria ectypa]
MNIFLAGLVLCHVPTFGLSALYPRDNKSLQPIHIPLSLSNQQYVINVVMSSGPQVQILPFVLSTATGYTAVAGTSCGSCGTDVYNISASTSAHQIPQTQDISLWSSSTSGSLITEDCSLKQGNGSTWSYTNQTIIVANQSQTIMPSSEFSGVLGLGSNARDGNFGASLAGNWLSQHPTRTNFTYAFALDSPHSAGTNGGMLHLMAQDSSAFQGDVTWKPMSDFNSSSTNSDWSVNMDAWSFESGDNGKISQNGDLVAVLDPFFATIRFPQAQARSIYSSLTRATIYSNSSETIAWEVPCDTKMTFTFTFGNFAATLDQTSLLRKSQGRCISYIEAWTDLDVGEYVLGASFISAIYLIFTMSGVSGGSVGMASRANSSKMSAGTIVAIVLSSLAFTIALVVAAVLVYRWWRKQRSPELSFKEDISHHYIPRVTPYFSTDLPSEATALMPISPPTPPQNRRVSASHSYRSEFQNHTSSSTGGESSQFAHFSDSSMYDEANLLGTPPPYGGSQFSRLYRQVHVVSVSPPTDRKGVPRENS